MTAPTHHTEPGPGWGLVRLAETSRDALAERVKSEIARGRHDYRPLDVGDLVSDRVRGVQENAPNRARLERFSDYVVPGEAIVEVGCGSGFVGARVLAAGAGSYRAMDLEAGCVRRTSRVLDALGLQDRVGPIVEKDLYTLEAPDLAGASLVICSEVIEHVPDPEGALEALGRALPDDADLLFSVPLLGRLEHVWGHLSIFTADRLRDMLDRAGLEARHVEPLADQWVLVLAGRAGATPANERLERVRAAAGRHGSMPAPAGVEPAAAQPTRFDNVAIDSVAVLPLEPDTGRVPADVTTAAAADPAGSISAEITAPPSLLRRPASGGIGLSLAGVGPVQGVRLQLSVDSLADVRDVTVTFRGPGAAVGGVWRWRPSRRDRQRTGSRTFSLRPGPDRPPFTSPRSADLTGAERVDVTATVRAGRTARIEILRLAWVR